MTFENTTVVLNTLNYPVHQVTWVNTAVAPNTQVGRHIASLKFYILNWKVNFLVASKACVPLHSCFKLLIQLKVSVFSSLQEQSRGAQVAGPSQGYVQHF